MRAFLLVAVVVFSIPASAQYYYKDIIGTQESADLVRSYIDNKVNRVVLTSYDAENTRIADFYIEQQFSPFSLVLKTITRTGATNPSVLFSYADADGNITRTVDSSRLTISTTTYNYNADGQLVSISHQSTDSSNTLISSDVHTWQWQGGNPVKMLRIRNGKDTSIITFKLDESGNVIEENETRRGVKSSPIYYYYNDENQLTDIVRHNAEVGILLPEYMFEYSEAGRVIQKITVPLNSSGYLIWRYQYNSNGLKTKEAIYDKYKSLNGKIEYQYSFGN